jgi:outer membrane immunogenic protein
MLRTLKSTSSIVALGLSLGLATSASIAADLPGSPVYNPPPAPFALSWHGFYLGAHVGSGQANMDGSFKAAAGTSSSVYFDQLDLTGVLYGIHGGYNWDMGSWVVGVEADISGMDWSDRAFAIESSENASADVNMLASIRGRIGIPIGQERRGLLYATGGIAFVNADLTVNDSAPPNSTDKLNFNDIGGVIGAGFEWAATDQLRVRAEGLYYWFGDKESISLTSADAGDFGELDDALVARVGVSWYFNTP